MTHLSPVQFLQYWGEDGADCCAICDDWRRDLRWLWAQVAIAASLASVRHLTGWVRQYEFSDPVGGGICPQCAYDRRRGHESYCPLAATLRNAYQLAGWTTK